MRDPMHSGRNTKKSVDATRPGQPQATESGMTGDGEGMGVGSRYSATLNERANKSLRNVGPDRPSADNADVPTVGMGVRKTGRV